MTTQTGCLVIDSDAHVVQTEFTWELHGWDLSAKKPRPLQLADLLVQLSHQGGLTLGPLLLALAEDASSPIGERPSSKPESGWGES